MVTVSTCHYHRRHRPCWHVAGSWAAAVGGALLLLFGRSLRLYWEPRRFFARGWWRWNSRNRSRCYLDFKTICIRRAGWSIISAVVTYLWNRIECKPRICFCQDWTSDKYRYQQEGSQQTAKDPHLQLVWLQTQIVRDGLCQLYCICIGFQLGKA